MKKTYSSTVLRLTESALLLALAAVLSLVKLFDLPYGGSITACSMLPIILIAYRYGFLWGTASGFIYGVLQLLFGMNTLSYATSPAAAVAIIFLDYLFAFSAMGVAGLFKNRIKNQSEALAIGAVTASALRYVFHVISGCTVWAGLSIPSTQAFIYSLIYNATYMLPELLVTTAGAVYLSGVFDFSSERIGRRVKTVSAGVTGLYAVGTFAALAAFVADVCLIAKHLQNKDTGTFLLSGFKSVSWPAVLIIAACGAVICLVCCLIANKNKKSATH